MLLAKQLLEPTPPHNFEQEVHSALAELVDDIDRVVFASAFEIKKRASEMTRSIEEGSPVDRLPVPSISTSVTFRF